MIFTLRNISVVCLVLYSVVGFYSCDPHDSDDIQFIVRNSTSEVILWDSYNSGENRAVLAEIAINDTYITGGGGILTVDSVILIRRMSSDSIVFRSERFGDDLNRNNHFFNPDNWAEERFNKYYLTITDRDFDN